MTSTKDNDDECNNEVQLWSREETPLLRIPIGAATTTTTTTTTTLLSLRQIPSHDDGWGIHSCVWDGGLGLVAYLEKELSSSRLFSPESEMVVVDLGSGTGIVGLACAVLAKQQHEPPPRISPSRVFLTDLPQALDLLHTNVQLNQPWIDGENEDGCVSVQELTWGESIPLEVRRQCLLQNEVLLLGADIIYRQNLFGPLLETLRQFFFLFDDDHLQDAKKIRCLLSLQSIRQHAQAFFQRAKDMGFSTLHLANVMVIDDTHHDDEHQPSPSPSPPIVMSPDETTKGPGIVYIIELYRE